MGVETCDGSSPPQSTGLLPTMRTGRERHERGRASRTPPGGPDGDRGHCDTVNCGVTTG